jgi:hypothetical protein
MDDMDDLFPGVGDRRDRSKKEKKGTMGDFFKIHSSNNNANLMGMFGGGSSEDTNKNTDQNEEDIKGTKSSKSNPFITQKAMIIMALLRIQTMYLLI